MRLLTLFAGLILTGSLFAQQKIKYHDKIFDNGLKYPKVELVNGDDEAEDTINKRILAEVIDLKSQDFCVGDYGFVQKGMHVQILLYCNCIDMAQSENRYLFFNFETGLEAPTNNIFDEKRKDETLRYIRSEMSKFTPPEACKEEFDKIPEDFDWSDIDLRLSMEGLEVRPVNSTKCEKAPLRIAWNDVRSLLKYSFI